MLKVFGFIFIVELIFFVLLDLIKNIIINYKINKNFDAINKLNNINNIDYELEEAEKIIDSYKEV